MFNLHVIERDLENKNEIENDFNKNCKKMKKKKQLKENGMYSRTASVCTSTLFNCTVHMRSLAALIDFNSE